MKYTTSIFAYLLLLSILVSFHAYAGDNFAAILTVVYPDVELRRVSTEEWFALPEGSMMPYGQGDYLRTGDSGRVLLTFFDEIELLLLPNSVYEITSFTYDSDEKSSITQEATLEGHGIVRAIGSREDFHYILQTEHGVISDPIDALIGVWTDIDNQTIVTVAEGAVSVGVQEQIEVLKSGQGLVTDGLTFEATNFDMPYNAVQLLGLQGCEGTAQLHGASSLNVRGGIGRGYIIVGYFFDVDPVNLIGVNESGTWYRVQFQSSLGWVDARSINTECTELPIFPDEYIEIGNRVIFDVQAIEPSFLTAFYGTPGVNYTFYR